MISSPLRLAGDTSGYAALQDRFDRQEGGSPFAPALDEDEENLPACASASPNTPASGKPDRRARPGSYACPHCAYIAKPRPIHIKHRLHAVLTLFSGGLWAVSWLALVISRRQWPYQCRRCGARISAEIAELFRTEEPNADAKAPYAGAPRTRIPVETIC